jgi:hypothetical protein
MGQLVELDAQGKLDWTRKTGNGLPVLGPVLTTNGTRVVVTNGAEVLGMSPSGASVFERRLPVASIRHAAPPLATRDGGFVIAASGGLFHLDASGDLQARAAAPEPPAALLEHAGRILMATQRGDVLEWKPPAGPTKLGSFGGRVEGSVALSSPNHLTAVVDHERLVDFKLSAKTRHIRLSSSERLEGTPAILKTGETRVTTFGGLLLGHDRSGLETSRANLEPASASGLPSLPGMFQAPPVIVDAKGRVAFVRPGLDAGVVLPTGEQKSAAGAACGDPQSLVPAGPNRFVVACRSGLVMMIGQ